MESKQAKPNEQAQEQEITLDAFARKLMLNSQKLEKQKRESQQAEKLPKST